MKSKSKGNVCNFIKNGFLHWVFSKHFEKWLYEAFFTRQLFFIRTQTQDYAQKQQILYVLYNFLFNLLLKLTLPSLWLFIQQIYKWLMFYIKFIYYFGGVFCFLCCCFCFSLFFFILFCFVFLSYVCQGFTFFFQKFSFNRKQL